jgi:hypothetical protein
MGDAGVVMTAARSELERMRNAPSEWSRLDDELLRASVLWALQYDRRPTDLPLLRQVMDVETARCACDGGFDETAELAGFLLAEHRQVADVRRHWALKGANFDTACGYDSQYLFAAGVTATVRYVRETDQTDLFAYLVDNSGDVTEAELADWFASKRLWFPSDEAAEDPLTWVDRAQLAGDLVLARQWLDRWAADRGRDRETLSSLRYRLPELGDPAAAADIQRELNELSQDPMDVASGWQSVAELERTAGRLDASWDALQRCGQALDDVPEWERYGLGRSYVQELFQLASVTSRELAVKAFSLADSAAGRLTWTPPVLLDAAIAAASRLGDEGRAQHYRALGGE